MKPKSMNESKQRKTHKVDIKSEEREREREGERERDIASKLCFCSLPPACTPRTHTQPEINLHKVLNM